MKKYSKPVAEIEMFESTDIITLSGTELQDALDEGYDADGLGLSE